MRTASRDRAESDREALDQGRSLGAVVECLAWRGPTGQVDDDGNPKGFCPGFYFSKTTGLEAYVLPVALVKQHNIPERLGGYWGKSPGDLTETQTTVTRSADALEPLTETEAIRRRKLQLIRENLVRVRIAGLPPGTVTLPKPDEYRVVVFGPYPDQARIGILIPVSDPNGKAFLKPDGIPPAKYERAVSRAAGVAPAAPVGSAPSAATSGSPGQSLVDQAASQAAAQYAATAQEIAGASAAAGAVAAEAGKTGIPAPGTRAETLPVQAPAIRVVAPRRQFRRAPDDCRT